MSITLLLSLLGVFVSVAVLAGYAASRALAWASPGQQRLRDLAAARADGGSVGVAALPLETTPDPAMRRLSKALPKSPKEMGRLKRQLAAAGYYDLTAAVWFSAAKVAAPAALGGLAVLILGVSEGWLLGLLGAVIGYLLPDLMLARLIRRRVRAIDHGLPDVLDLMIVCIEAGSGLDQAIAKASEELEVAHPALAQELRLVTTEIRAGKPRAEAFANLAARTQVDDVRGLVTMLTQTDRFGTSIAQALRIHAQTSRTKRRQRAEERAAKIGVKLIFPLVLCVFPAVYVVCIGPAVIAIYRALF
jgi:tight adherence protein C